MIFACDSRATRRGPRGIGGGRRGQAPRAQRGRPSPAAIPSFKPRRASGIPAVGALADARSCRSPRTRERSGCDCRWAPAAPLSGQVAQRGGDAGDLEPAGRRGGGVLERLRQATGASETAVGDLDSPGVPDGPEGGLLVVPSDPAELDVVVATEGAGSSRGDPSVYQDQLEPVRDALRPRCSSISSLARFSWVDAGTTSAATGRPVTSTATTRFAPLVRP